MREHLENSLLICWALHQRVAIMEEVYARTARFMERNEEFQKNLRQALVMPLMVRTSSLKPPNFFSGVTLSCR